MGKTRIVLGADHGGFLMKEKLKKWLKKKESLGVFDVGALKMDKKDDFVDYAVLVAGELEENSGAKGILFCRNGFGMVMAANRFLGVRCGLGFNIEVVKKGRNDDDINCLAIPADYINFEKLVKMVEAFLKTKYSGEERFRRRLFKLEMIEGSERGNGGCSSRGKCGSVGC